MDNARDNFKAMRVNKFPCLTYENIYPKKSLVIHSKLTNL